MINTVAGRSIGILLLLGAIHSLQAQNILWPGDINNNGIVNGEDAHYWALANGAEDGPERLNTNIEWAATPFIPWEETFIDSIDLAFADCNGDGEVDEEDLEEVVLKNFGQSRPPIGNNRFSETDSERGIPLVIRARQNTIRPKEGLDLNIRLGTPGQRVENFLGLTFDLVYDPAIIDEESFVLEASDAWSGDDEDLITFTRKGSNTDPGRTTVGFLRAEPIPLSGGGDVGEIFIVIEDIAVGITELEIGIENVLITNDGLEIASLRNRPERVRIPFEDSITNIPSNQDQPEEIRIYPNPAYQHLTLELPATENWLRAEVMNLKGKLMATYSISGFERINLPLEDFPTGNYFLRVVGQKRTENIRFLLGR